MIEARNAITINRPAEELYRYWRELPNLPKFVTHLESVEVTGERRSHWRAKAAGWKTVEWEAEITEDRPNELIAWQSIPGSQVETAGWIRFEPAPGGRGTEVHVELYYRPPGGTIGATIAWFLGNTPDQQLGTDLRHFKQLMETGELILSDGAGDGSRIVQRPAQPPA
jgi:uncharacterized membrane protein